MILIFGGTTEGRMLAEYFIDNDIPAVISVATEYGRMVLPENLGRCKVITGRMDGCEMADYILANDIDIVIDATHPYAIEVTENITWAVGAVNRERMQPGMEAVQNVQGNIPKLIRVVRDNDKEAENGFYFDSLSDVIDYLNTRKGNVFVTTGSKELSQFISLSNFEQRVYARILPVDRIAESLIEKGFLREHLICGRGPFGVQANVEAIRNFNAKFLVTKDTGKEGGFYEKAEAAQMMGVELLVIKRPLVENGYTVEQVKREVLI